jgi:hypothetical protein
LRLGFSHAASCIIQQIQSAKGFLDVEKQTALKNQPSQNRF